MSKNPIKMNVIKKKICMTQDEKTGEYHFFSGDPLDKNSQEVQIGDVVKGFTEVGGSADNPIVLVLTVGICQRHEPFNFERAREIAADVDGEWEVRDRNGEHVDILPRMANDQNYPINAVVYNADGSVLANRRYALDGACSTRDERQRLVLARKHNSDMQ